jgi:hypothetical protein
MHIGSLLLARHVRTETAVTLEGIYDEITAASFPATIDEMCIWLRVFYAAAEVGAHPFELTIWDVSTGQQVGQTATQLSLPVRPERAHPSNDLTINLANAQIPHPGEYEFRVNIGADASAAAWLTVTQRTDGAW